MTEAISLYPEIEPFNQGSLDVGDGHEIYFEQCGNPNGFPLVVLHGGPGAGCNPKMRRFFNPERWSVVLFDQRGSGKSRPFGSIENNTTSHLVGDITKLLDSLGVEKAVVFGGSWGTTLALAYAIRHPERVAGLILRGIFFGDKRDVDWYFRGGAGNIFPASWARFAQQVPEAFRDSPADYYFNQFVRTDVDDSVKDRLAAELGRYEFSMSHLIQPSEESIAQELASYSVKSLAIMELHYLLNDCFLEAGHLLNNAPLLTMPTTIIHGKYDMVCPPVNAYELRQAMPHAKMVWCLSGHSGGEPEIQEALLRETDAMYDIICTQ